MHTGTEQLSGEPTVEVQDDGHDVIRQAIVAQLCDDLDVIIVAALEEGKPFAFYQHQWPLSSAQSDGYPATEQDVDAILLDIKSHYEQRGIHVLTRPHEINSDSMKTNITINMYSVAQGNIV